MGKHELEKELRLFSGVQIRSYGQDTGKRPWWISIFIATGRWYRFRKQIQKFHFFGRVYWSPDSRALPHSPRPAPCEGDLDYRPS